MDAVLRWYVLSMALANVVQVVITVCTWGWAMAVHSVPSLLILMFAFAMTLLKSRPAVALSRFALHCNPAVA
jgi:hypothetical protein